WKAVSFRYADTGVSRSPAISNCGLTPILHRKNRRGDFSCPTAQKHADNKKPIPGRSGDGFCGASKIYWSRLARDALSVRSGATTKHYEWTATWAASITGRRSGRQGKRGDGD